MGKFLILAGLVLIGAGVLVLGGERIGLHPGRLPGDLRIQGKNSVVYIPIATCFIVSLILSIISWLVRSR